MVLEEILKIDPEIRSDLQNFETILRQRRGHGIAGNCFLVSANIAPFVETAIQMEFPKYEKNKIIVHIGNLGANRDTGDEWLWSDEDIIELSKDPGGLPFIPGQGYHSWLTFDDVIIDPTIDYTMEIRDVEQQGPIYFDGHGASHPPKLRYIYRSLKSFGLGDLFRYPALDIR